MPFNSILSSNPNLILNILVLFSFSFRLCCASDQLLTGDSFTVSSFSYPEATLRPFDLRYIRGESQMSKTWMIFGYASYAFAKFFNWRDEKYLLRRLYFFFALVELPTWFSAVSIALHSDVDLDVTKVEKVPQSMLPVACFREGSPPLPDASNISLKEPAISGMNNLYVEQCFHMQKNITLRLTNEQISPGVWYIGLFNGIGPARTQSKMIIRGPTYSFSANISVKACTNTMMMGQFCNSTVYPLSCTGPDDVFDASEDVAVKPMVENVMPCTNNFENLCVREIEAKVYSLDIMNMVEELSIMATNVSFSSTSSTNGANDVNLLCFVRHGAMPSATLHDYSSNLYKAPLTIQSPLIGRWYIIVVPLNLTRKTGAAADSDVRICYSVESQLSECPFGKTGPNCTMASYKLQTVLSRGISPFESYYLPIGGEVSSDSAKFPLEPLLSSSSNGWEPDNIWIYFTMDIPRGAAGGNIHVHLSSNVKIGYEVYARFGGLPSLDSWDYYYANKSRRSDSSMFFMLYDSREDKVDFYIIYAREGTWGIGVRHLNNINSDSSKEQTFMFLSLERCPNRCSSHGSCKFSFDASGLASYSFCSCDRDHGGFDCGIELVSHKGHIRQSIFLIASNAAAILPAFWALRQKAWAEWIMYTASGISSGLYHACDVGTWCALNYNALQFMDFWLSFMAVISTFVYLATISEAFKRAIHTAVAILTALMAVTNATRSSNIILVIVIGTIGLLIGWLIELSANRSLSFSFGVPSNFRQSWQAIKQWLSNLVKTLLKRFRWGFVLAGFAALAMAATSWTLETSETYWFWHSWWHITIYASSFFFLCSKANIVDSDENQPPPSSGNYELTRQYSFPRGV